MGPFIGITCDQEEDRLSITDYYGKAIGAVGGIPILLPVTGEERLLTAYEEFLDGLLLTGGADLDPQLFGEEPLKGLGTINPKRDFFELELCKRFLVNQKPILGICRGLQVLNVAAGGTLFQDIFSQIPKSIQHQQKAPKNYPSHSIVIQGSSLLQGLLKASSLRVNSFHHQAVKTVAEGFQGVAWASDGVIEAIEKEIGFAVGVQWHPERLWQEEETQKRLFGTFIKATSRIKAG